MSADNQPGNDQARLTRRQFIVGAGVVGAGTAAVIACETLSRPARQAATIVATLEKTATPKPTETTPPTKETDPWHKYGELAQQVWSQNPNLEAPQWDELTTETQSRVEHLVGYALTEDGRDPQNVGLNPVGRMALPENVFASAQTLTTPDNKVVTRVQLVVKDASDPEGSIQPGDMIYLRPDTESAQHTNHSLVRTTQEGTHIDWTVVGEQGDFQVVPREVHSNGRTVRVAFDENADRFNQNIGAVPSTGSAAGGPESTVNIITDASGIPTAAAIKFEAGAGSVTDVPLSISELKDQSGETAGFGLSTPEGTPVAHKYGRQPWEFAESPEPETLPSIDERVNMFLSGELIVDEKDVFRLDSQHPDRIEPFGQVIRHPVPNDGQGGSVSEHAEVQVVTLGMEVVQNVAVLYAGIYEPGTTRPRGVAAFTPGYAALPQGYTPALESHTVDVQQINQNPPIWYPASTQAITWDQPVVGLGDLISSSELVGRGSVIQYPVNTNEKTEEEMVATWGPSGFGADELRWAFRVSQNEQLTQWMEGKALRPDCVIDAGNVATLDQFRKDIPLKVLPDITVWRIPAKPDPVKTS